MVNYVLTLLVLQYTVCNFELPNTGKFPYYRKFPYHGFLQGFLHDLIIGLPYPGKAPYPVKAPIRKSTHFFERNNNQRQKLSGRNDSLYLLSPFMVQSHLLTFLS